METWQQEIWALILDQLPTKHVTLGNTSHLFLPLQLYLVSMWTPPGKDLFLQLYSTTHTRWWLPKLTKTPQSSRSPNSVLSDDPFDEPFHDSLDLWFEKLAWHEKIRDSHTYQGVKQGPNEFKIQGSWAGWPVGWGACQQDTAPIVSLLGYTTTLKETGPATGASNALQCSGTGWP